MKKVAISGENFEKCISITNKINMLLNTVDKDTAIFSTHKQMYEHQDFKTLKEMGPRIIPYLFHRMIEHGCSWTILSLLQEITGHNPIPKELWGYYYASVMCWLQWYIASEYRDHDVYFGLVDEE